MLELGPEGGGYLSEKIGYLVYCWMTHLWLTVKGEEKKAKCAYYHRSIKSYLAVARERKQNEAIQYNPSGLSDFQSSSSRFLPGVW